MIELLVILSHCSGISFRLFQVFNFVINMLLLDYGCLCCCCWIIILLFILWGLLVDDIVVWCEREESRRTGRGTIAIHKSCVDAESTVAVPSIIATDALVEVRS